MKTKRKHSDGLFIGRYYGKAIHAREVTAWDEAGAGLVWVRLRRFGDEWLLLEADPGDVERKVRKVRQIPEAGTARFPRLGPDPGPN
ncbi:MAG: hypothetical protein OXH49_11395 [Gemmatimonadetes bacterium]|nr:hypothetical protein [Gemmatimonadota bacterium]